MYIAGQKPVLGTRLNKNHRIARNLIGCWLMNEGGGQKVFDVSGNNYVGTIDSALSWIPGDSGPVIQFIGVNTQDIEIPCAAGSPADLTGKGTIIVKHKLSVVDGTARTLVGRHDNQMFLFFEGNSGGKSRYQLRVATGTTEVISNYIITANWHTVAVTCDTDANVAKIYQDGVFDNEDTSVAYNMASSSNSWHIGEDPRDGTGLPYNGLIEYVYIFNRALTASEITQLYVEPFAMFGRRARPELVYVAEAPPTVKPWWYYQQQMGGAA